MTELYLDSSQSFPYCAGCGHPHVLRSLDQALREQRLEPGRAVLVTDIGCVGLADRLFPTTHTVHTLHGRSVAVASGIQLGVLATGGSPLPLVVLIGDGGAGMGLVHLVQAAQLDVDLTVLVHNNLLYGMTGGQHSVSTPTGMRTATTPEGNPVPPLDIGALLLAAGAGFFARAVAPSKQLDAAVARAIARPGFACVEALELCPTFASKRGGVTGKTLRELGLETGVIRDAAPRAPTPAQGTASRAKDRATAAPDRAMVPEPSWGTSLARPLRIVLAGRAGEGVQSAARVAAYAAAAAGMHATLRADYPVTQGSGHSIAELTIGSEPILFTGMTVPDAVIITAAEGRAQLEASGRLDLAAGVVLIDAELVPLEGARAQPLRATYGARNATLGALIELTEARGCFDRRAWQAAIDALADKPRSRARETFDRALATADGD